MTLSPVSHSNYTLLDERPLPLWNAVGWTYRHRTGTRVLSIVTPDDNKTFGIVFPTPPDDHSGLPHILEHSVLCGSQRFPMKEPFKEMLKTSLQTFLNAFTYPDRTCYPVASRNLKDFYNLMDVYLDAVFFPRLTPAVLGQEGWRHQWNKDGALEIQGVVYNEMKGVYASPDSRLGEITQQALFPDTIYSFDSGGVPAHIPELTFESFQTFHKRYYHPANAVVGFYGDDDPLARLERLDAVLSQVPPGPPADLPALQTPWTSTKRTTVGYPAGEGHDEGIFCQTNWLLTGETADPEGRQIISLVSHLLMYSAASPLRLALQESGLGEDLLGGPLTHLRQPAFSAGLQGVDPGNEEKVFDLVHQSLVKIAKDNFRPQLIEGILNQTDFRMREMNSSAKGLGAILGGITPWLYGGDPLEALDPEPLLKDIRGQLERSPRLFADWVQEHLVDNPARIEICLVPDQDLAGQEREAEEEKIRTSETLFASDSERRKEAETLVEEVRLFQETPDSPEALASLPRLRLADLHPLPPHPLLHQDDLSGTDLTLTEVDSAGIVYLELAFDVHSVPLGDLPLLPIYNRCLNELGTHNLDHLRFNEEVACHTGGISMDIKTSETYREGETLAILLIKAKAVADKADRLIELLSDMLLEPLLGPAKRIHQLLLEERALEESNLTPSGNHIVSLRLKAHHSAMERASEQMDGSSNLVALRELEKLPPEDLQHRIKDLHQRIIRRSHLRAHIGGRPEDLAPTRTRLENMVARLPDGPALPPETWPVLSSETPEALLVPSPVNFVGLSTPLAMKGPADHYSQFVARRLLNNDYLWEQVRVQGGSYGCYCGFSHLDGLFTFASYRDPHLDRTLKVYREAGKWLSQLSMTVEDLEQAKIGTLGKLDPPERPATLVSKSFYRHMIGLSYERRLRFWEQVLETETTHLQAFGQQLEQALREQTQICMLGGKKAVSEAEGTFSSIPLM